ncbi:MAG: outer capsid protein Hoc [bacterium]|nr:outer capsid protein Hoc [bacterium]
MAYPSRAIFGLGTRLDRGDGQTPENYSAIAEVRSISGPSMATDILDVTNHESQGGVREFKAGLIDPGELTFDCAFQPGEPSHGAKAGLQKAQLDRAVDNYNLVFPPGIGFTWLFQGIVTGLPLTFPIDEVITSSVTLKVSGLPNFEYATPPGW